MDNKRQKVSGEVHDFLSRNGQKGGQVTHELIEFAKRKLEEGGMSLAEFEEQVENGTWTGDLRDRKIA